MASAEPDKPIDGELSRLCSGENAFPYTHSLVDAVDQNRVHVRLLVENENMNGMENQVGIQILPDELMRQGLENHLEIRFFN